MVNFCSGLVKGAIGLLVLGLAACAPVAGEPQAPPLPVAAPSTSREVRRATVVMNGDLLWHNTLVHGAREDHATAGGAKEPAADGATTEAAGLDFSPLLAGVRPLVEEADLGICHNEVPVAPSGGPYAYYPAFRAPQETLDAVRATGYDLCTTASNHSLDDGWPGLVRTVEALQTRGLLVAGTAITAEAARHPPIYTTAAGVRIAVVTGTYATNGIPRPRGKEWSVPDLNPEMMLQRAATARADGADIVLVAVHGGVEYDHEPDASQRALAERLTASPDVDLVYGHHAHVVQPWTRVNDKWVAFGLGNLVAQHKADVPAGYEGVTARFTFVETVPGRFGVEKAEYAPTLVTRYHPGKPARVLLINRALTEGSVDRDRLMAARERTRRVVHSLGGTDGLIEI